MVKGRGKKGEKASGKENSKRAVLKRIAALIRTAKGKNAEIVKAGEAKNSI
jgi:hypothetical protein